LAPIRTPHDRGGLRGRRRNWRRDVADNKEGLDDPSGLSRSYEMRDHPHVFAEIPRGGAERCLQEQKAVERPRSRGRDLRSASSRGSRWRSVRCGPAFGFDLKGLETNRCDREASLGLMWSNSIIAYNPLWRGEVWRRKPVYPPRCAPNFRSRESRTGGNK
jgi:hypothetical protein